MVKTISELIKLLQEVSAEHGDLEVKLLNRNDDNPMRGCSTATLKQ